VPAKDKSQDYLRYAFVKWDADQAPATRIVNVSDFEYGFPCVTAIKLLQTAVWKGIVLIAAYMRWIVCIPLFDLFKWMARFEFYLHPYQIPTSGWQHPYLSTV
jgi:hypothetical protein